MLMDCMQSPVAKLVLAASALCVAGGTNAQAIELENFSFEGPSVLSPSNPFISIGVAVGIEGWQATFPGSVPDTLPIPPGVMLPPEILGQLNVGVFLNVEVPIEPGVVIPPIANAVGSQVAFILVNPDANGIDEPQVSIFQETQSLFTSDTDYTFTLGIGNAVTFAADDTASLILSIGTIDSSGAFQATGASSTIFASELVNDGSGLLTDFSVSLASSDLSSDLLGEQVAVQIRQAGGLGGGFNFDNARLTAVPEPTSLSLLAMGGLMLARRRRR